MKAKIQHEIQEYCSLLRLNAISEHFEEAITSATDYEGFLHQLLRMEVDAEEERAKERKIKAAKFPYRKYIEDLEMDLLPEGMRNRLPELCSLDFIREGKNIIMTGNPGTGKTHTAIGLGIKACEQGYRVLYTTIPYLVTELKESNSKQKLRTYQKRFEKYDLIIADELGYISFDREAADLLFTVLSLRASQKSTIITSNLTFERWDEIFGDAAITSAIVDRLTYKAYLIDMEGDSYRLRETLRSNGTDFETVVNIVTAPVVAMLQVPNLVKSDLVLNERLTEFSVDIYNNRCCYI